MLKIKPYAIPAAVMVTITILDNNIGVFLFASVAAFLFTGNTDIVLKTKKQKTKN